MKISPNYTQARVVRGQVVSPAIPAFTITVREVGWQHVDIQWVDDSSKWNNPAILQRKSSGSFPTPNLSAAQDIETNFIYIGVRNANRYTDLGLTPDTIYDYRVCYVTNWEAVVRDGTAETLSEWQYGQATTTKRETTLSWPQWEGYGANVSGGRGGTVVHVTNLNASGSGSLLDAISASNRIVVFDVGGVIDMAGANLDFDGDNITVAGQTAPSPGITIKDAKGFRIVSQDNIIIQHIRLMIGAATHKTDSVWEPDGFAITDANRVVIDHCSVYWAVDENVAINRLPYFDGSTHEQMLNAANQDITISNCIVAEGLSNATHRNGEHSKGILVGPLSNRVSIIKNLIAHNVLRNPHASSSTRMEVINNVIYNAGQRAMQYFAAQEASVLPPDGQLDVIGNIFQKGPNSSYTEMIWIRNDPYTKWGSKLFDLYYRDNLKYKSTGGVDSALPDVVERVSNYGASNYAVGSATHPSGQVTEIDKNAVAAYVEANVGSRPWQSNDHDNRIINEWKSRSGSIPNYETDRGGFPSYTATSRDASWDTNGDGMPDQWKTFKGLTVATDNGADFDLHPNLTNLEVYFQEVGGGTFVSYNVVDDFGAVGNNSTNDWQAFQDAFSAMRAQPHVCELFIPAGTYLLYPTNGNVKWNGTYLTVTNGLSYEKNFIVGDTSNMIIRGDVDGSGVPNTFLNMRLWHNRPGTEWLNIMKTPGGNPAVDNDIYNIRRYGFWDASLAGTNIENVSLQDIDINMTAVPVSTGKGWYTLADKRYQWDTSQKLVFGFHNTRNIYLKNVRAKNIRGEIAYWGGFGCEKYKMVDCVFSQSNSSIVSMSADAEYENCTFSDMSNAGIESAPHYRSGNAGQPQLISNFSGLPMAQDTIVRGCTFRPYDQTANGVMKTLGDLAATSNAFGGIHIFNQVGTFQTVTDCTVIDFRNFAYAPWYECDAVLLHGNTFENPVKTSGSILYFNPRSFPLYQLSGGMDYVYIGSTTINMSAGSLDNAGALYKNFASMNSQANFYIDKLTVNGNSKSINHPVQDQYTNASGRTNYKWRDWTFTSLTIPDKFNMFINLNSPDSTLPLPLYEDMSTAYHVQQFNAGQNMEIEWSETDVRGLGQGASYSISGIVNIHRHPVDSILKLRPYNSGDTITFPANANWNNFTQNYSITGTQVLTCKVVSVGTKKLQHVSIA